MTSKKIKHDTNSQGYTNALLEDMNEKFELILETTRPIPKMQEDIASLLEWREKAEPRLDAVYEAVQRMEPRLQEVEKRLNALEQKLDATFDEVGSL